MDAERLARFALWLTPGVSLHALDAACARLGSARAALSARRDVLARALGDRGAGGLARMPADLASHAARLQERVERAGGRVLLHGDRGYPDMGKLADPPAALCVRGGDLAERAVAVAVVGSRACDAAGRDEARRIAAELARAGRVVISGGALGIDAAAHGAALEAGGRTVVVLGSGVLRPGPPSHRNLFGRVLEQGGALISELPPLEPSRPMQFPRRNRLIAALSTAVVVVRAGARSGTLHTQQAACRIGVPVFAAAHGGPGCQEAIAAGAHGFGTTGELFAGLGLTAPPSDPLLAALGARASVPSVAARTGLPVGEVARRLAALCAAGRVRPGGPGEFVRV